MKAWQRIEPTTETKVGWRKITTKTFKMPDGTTATFDTLHPDGQQFAGAIALTSDNRVVIARQYRPGPEKIMDELPGGFVDAGEDIDTCMRRELLEETGYKAGKTTYLGSFHKDAYMNATWHVFLAQGCVEVAKPTFETDEHVEVTTITIDQLINNAKNDKMMDQAAVLMAYDALRQIQKEEA